MAKGLVRLQARWRGGTAFEATNERGGRVLMGETETARGLGAMETLLAAVAGCTGYDVVMILQKMRVPFTDVRLEITGQRRDEHPRVYTRIHITYHIYGDNVDPKAVEKAIRLSLEKYCSASATLAAWAELTHSYVLHPAAEAARDD